MTPLTRSITAALLGVRLAVAGLASAAVTPRVSDDAKFFSPGAVEQANQKIREIYRDYGKDLLIETVLRVPADLQPKYKALGKTKFFADWAARRAEDSGCKGIYVLLCKTPGHLQIEVGRLTRQRGFTLEDRNRLVQKMLPLLVKKDQKNNDAALALAVDTIESTLRASLGKQTTSDGKPAKEAITQGSAKPRPTVPASHPPANRPDAGGSPSLWTWVLIGVGGVVVIWLLFAMLRAVTGGGAAGPGGSGGMGGGGGGGGGR